MAVRLSSIVDLPNIEYTIKDTDIFLVSLLYQETNKYLSRKATLSSFPIADASTNGFMCSADWNILHDISAQIETIYDKILDITYPINSIYTSVNKDLPSNWPDNFKAKWTRIAAGRCLFGADENGLYSPSETITYNVGDEVDAGLPKISATTTITNTEVNFSGTTNNNDDGHNHGISAYSAFDTIDTGEDSTIKLKFDDTSKTGKHLHSFNGTAEFNPTATTTITTGIATTNTVQPPALVVSMWKRTEL